MRKPAKILLAGTLVAILPCGAATSLAQSPVLNEQIQLDDLTASQTLNVETVTDETVGVATASGASFGAQVDGGDLDVRSYQQLDADVSAESLLNAASSTGASTVMSTAASGNLGDAGVYAGVLSTAATQTSGAGRIAARSQVEAPNAEAGDLSASVQALGNSQGFSVSAGSAGVLTTQNNGAEIDADGGGVVGQVSGAAIFSAAASANNITSAADSGSSERMVADQNNEGALVQAAQFTAFGAAYVAQTSATATGNNLSAANQGALLDVTSLQQNQAYVRAQSESSAYGFGSATASAYGVGNSLLAGQLGQEVIIDSEQLNAGGGVEVIAAFTGGEGYDAAASSMAMGNAATGYACADCDGAMTVSNRQTNGVGVSATSTLTITGSARSATSSAHAVGNTASYSVTRPE